METITISKQAFTDLVNAVVTYDSEFRPYPRPNWYTEVFLNPQPLPPRAPDGPGPEPWVVGGVARARLTGLLDQFDVASTENTEPAGRAVSRLVDELCPERPRWRPPRRRRVLDDALAILSAATQFEEVATRLGEHPLQSAVAAGAERLLATGLSRLEGPA